MVAAWVLWTARADQVWLLPAYRHAFEKLLAPWEARLEMAEALASAVGPRVRVEPIEAELPVPSYTVRTLDTLAARHPEHTFHLVVGADILPQLPLWKDSARLQATYPLVVVGRQGHAPVADAPSFPDVSSTTIRERLARGAPIDHLVPESVARVISARRLYREA
jgi:nicotinate-nucleotide adenylyltransferase